MKTKTRIPKQLSVNEDIDNALLLIKNYKLEKIRLAENKETDECALFGLTLIYLIYWYFLGSFHGITAALTCIGIILCYAILSNQAFITVINLNLRSLAEINLTAKTLRTYKYLYNRKMYNRCDNTIPYFHEIRRVLGLSLPFWTQRGYDANMIYAHTKVIQQHHKNLSDLISEYY